MLQAAWAKKDIRVNDRRIYFDEDFTNQVFKERAKYRQVRKQLQERKIKSRKTEIIRGGWKNQGV